MFAVVKIRGGVGLKPVVRTTLELLGLKRNHTVAITGTSDDFKGMIHKIKDYVAWGEVSKDTLKKLEELKAEGDKVKRYRLHPPRGGFRRTTKRPRPDGELGYRGAEINKLIERMIP